jgi:outer membrane protein
MRMTRFLAVLGLVAALGIASAARAEDVKFGIVDLDQALNATEEGKSAREELERKQREARSKVQPMVERFETLQQEIQGKKFVLSEEVLYQKQLDLIELRNEIESQMKELEGKLKVDQERIVGPLRKKLIDIVQRIGREQGYTVIIERGTPGLLYSREALDVTDQVIAQFDKTG